MQKFLTQTQRRRILADMKPLADLLKEWRATLTITPAEAARRCKLSPQMWSQLEGGETDDPRSSTLLKLAEGTGFPMERLAKAAEMQRAVPA